MEPCLGNPSLLMDNIWKRSRLTKFSTIFPAIGLVTTANLTSTEEFNRCTHIFRHWLIFFVCYSEYRVKLIGKFAYAFLDKRQQVLDQTLSL